MNDMNNKLTPAMRTVLPAILVAQDAFSKQQAPPKWKRLASAEHAATVEYGVRYAPRAWWGHLTAAELLRLRRAVYALAELNLLTITMSVWGNRMERVRLTPTGEAIAAQLAPTEPTTPAADTAGNEAPNA